MLSFESSCFRMALFSCGRSERFTTTKRLALRRWVTGQGGSMFFQYAFSYRAALMSVDANEQLAVAAMPTCYSYCIPHARVL